MFVVVGECFDVMSIVGGDVGDYCVMIELFEF